MMNASEHVCQQVTGVCVGRVFVSRVVSQDKRSV